MNVQTFDPTCDSFGYEFAYNIDETSSLHRLLNRNPKPTIDDLRRVSLWKIDRVLHIEEDTLKLLGSLAGADINVESPLSKDCLLRLVDCQGIGYPMASAILKFLRPDIFPIIDARAYRAIYGRRLAYSSYTLERYLDYALKIQDLAIQMRVELREVDEQLYCFDKVQNGKL
jgi:hypothetical protein